MQLDEIPILIEPLLSNETRLLVIMNGLVEDDLVRAMRDHRRHDGSVGCRAVYGGMALICSNRLSPGNVSHTYGGKLVCGVAYSADAAAASAEAAGGAGGDGEGHGRGSEGGEGGWVDSDRRAIEDLFRSAPTIPFEFDPNLRRGR
jgi:ketopantoate reductase